jgi:LmbE family N-acetylglucosaminyl deacetylase
VAHPDDEAAGCGGLLQRMREPAVWFLTDGAPEDHYFWKRYGSREAYAELRRREAQLAMEAVGVRRWGFLGGGTGFTDQQLFRNVSRAITLVLQVVDEVQPEALLTQAYEGGHPDHDTCSFIAAQVTNQRGIPAWEFPLYHRSVDGVTVRQEFPFVSHGEVVLELTPAERQKKDQMLAAYPSQFTVLEQFNLDLEPFRPMANYDFTRPIHEGVLNYEAWQWSMTGKQVADAFAAYLQSKQPVEVKR